ncbi:hypothetical protein FS749_011923 [Ceratobasidium sp. UAMH 11750]|nr:hypothetical protein FS749_011923 [Ceratobasidium sp. UAMH 11750]
MDGIHAIQTIGKMWPTLEVLDLGFTVIDLLDLLCVSESLPKLKRLSMSLPTKISGERYGLDKSDSRAGYRFPCLGPRDGMPKDETRILVRDTYGQVYRCIIAGEGIVPQPEAAIVGQSRRPEWDRSAP